MSLSLVDPRVGGSRGFPCVSEGPVGGGRGCWVSERREGDDEKEN